MGRRKGGRRGRRSVSIAPQLVKEGDKIFGEPEEQIIDRGTTKIVMDGNQFGIKIPAKIAKELNLKSSQDVVRIKIKKYSPFDNKLPRMIMELERK